jgi:hypothetical protein
MSLAAAGHELHIELGRMVGQARVRRVKNSAKARETLLVVSQAVSVHGEATIRSLYP